MAPKNLDKVAAIKVKTKAPKTTPPVDPWDQAFNNALNTGTTTTTPATTVPPTPTTVAPIKQTGKQYQTVREAEQALSMQGIKASRAGVPQQVIKDVSAGKSEKQPGGFLGGLLKVINFDIIPGGAEFKPVQKFVIEPLTVIDTGRRAAVSGFKESVDLARQLTGRKEVYTATDYIPKHPQTKQPIAKIGDPVIENVEKVLNTPVPNMQNIKTKEQAIKATQDIVKKVATTRTGSASEFLKQTKDPTTGFGGISYLQTGNPWIDRITGFIGDVGLDPITYVAGPGALLSQAESKAAIKGGTKAAEAVAAKAARVAAEEAAIAAEKAVGTAAEAATKAAAKAAAKEAESLTSKVVRQAPRRTYGATSREALAEQVRLTRQEALKAAADATLSDAERSLAKKTAAALTDDFIAEVASKGWSSIKGEAAKALGVKSGLRIGLPTFGKATIGIPKVVKEKIPYLNKYTFSLTDFFGSKIAGGRIGLVNTKLGATVLSKITPLGEGGLLGSEDLLRLRTGLRSGTLKGAEAVDATTLLAADKYYRGILDVNRKNVASQVSQFFGKKSPLNAKIISSISEHLHIPPSDWTAAGLRPLNKIERQAYDTVKTTLDNWFTEAEQAASRLGVAQGTLPKVVDYFPRAQTEEAINWATKNSAKATTVAGDLGVDKTFFLGNFTERTLTPGKVWFGHLLTDADLAGGVKRLNQIAKDSGIIKFNFFEEDAAKALSTYAQNHAKYLAYANAIERLTVRSPAELGGLAENLGRKPVVTSVGTKPSIMNLGTLENTVANFMTPDRLTNWSEAQIIGVLDEIKNLGAKISSSSPILKAEFEDAVLRIDEQIAETTRLINAGVIDPTSGSLLMSELESYANNLAAEIGGVKSAFIGTPASRWSSVSKVMEDGFAVLNQKTIPDIAVRGDIAEMFKNVKRLDDPQFAAAAEKLLKDYNTFFKSAVTTTPGFHLRNSLGNLFMMFVAGAEPANLARGLKIWREWNKALKEGTNLDYFIRDLINRGVIKNTEEVAVRNAIAYSGATGFGQIGEISKAAGQGRVGFTGQAATGKIPFTDIKIPGAKKASEILGTPVYYSRKFGSGIEEFNRFQLTLDGLYQGLDGQSAAARTAKYLIDYNDLSTLDKNVKQVIPFWLWTSRNMPLQLESMWLNPKAYQVYNSFRRNIEDKNGTSPYLPDYLIQAGAFKLPFGQDLYLKPDLGFPGAQAPNPLQQILSGNPQDILSMVTPALRIPAELAQNKQFFSGAPIGDAAKQGQYAVQQGIPGLSTIGRLLSALPGTEPGFIQGLTGAKLDRELQASLSFIGSPAFKLSSAQERSAIWKRYFELKALTDKAAKEQQQKRYGK